MVEAKNVPITAKGDRDIPLLPSSKDMQRGSGAGKQPVDRDHGEIIAAKAMGCRQRPEGDVALVIERDADPPPAPGEGASGR
ncbi:hypothetical protein ACFSHP_08595 [Novosphingobium panipatense]